MNFTAALLSAPDRDIDCEQSECRADGRQLRGPATAGLDLFAQAATRALTNVVQVTDRTLLLMRHAKSDYPGGVADHDRPLAPRGIREAALAGDWLRASAPPIDAVLCSTAVRTRETLARIKYTAPVTYADRLYDAVPSTVIDEINRVGDDVTTLLVIGHEPAMSRVALGLADASASNHEAAESISTKFPTSAIAQLRIGSRWRDLRPGEAELLTFHVPR
jgi:phosphohistidine phosphatase